MRNIKTHLVSSQLDLRVKDALVAKVPSPNRGADLGSKKRVLIIAYHFPPLNTISAVRIGKIAKYLSEFGWEPIVLTADTSKQGLQTLPVEINEANIFRISYFDQYHFIYNKLVNRNSSNLLQKPQTSVNRNTAWKYILLSFIQMIRGFYTLPIIRLIIDPIGWYHPAVHKGLCLIAEHDINAIVSSYSPAISHFIARSLNKKTGIPWIAEFQDLWAENHNVRKTQPFYFFEQQLEKRTLKDSSLLITASEPASQKMETLHSKETITITNGFDEEDYIDSVSLSSKFIITYTGNLYRGKQDPTPLFEAIFELKHVGILKAGDFEVRFFGANIEATIVSSVRKYNLHDLVKIYGYVPFKESIKRQQESTILLLLNWNDPKEKGVYTGKIFEYLGAMRPILAIGLKEGVVADLLARTGSGIIATEVKEIKEVLCDWLSEFKRNGNISLHFAPKREQIYQYTQREHAKKLADVLNRIADDQVGRPKA